MKFDKAWCLAIGVFLGASAIPAAYAQKQTDQQNSSPNSAGEQSQRQNQPGSNAKGDPSSGQKQAGGSQDANSSAKSDQSSERKQRNGNQDANSSAKSDKSSGQKQANDNQNANSSLNKSQQGAGTLQFGDAQVQAWNYVLSADSQSWIRGVGSHSELDLVVADDSVREHLNLPKGQGIVVNEVAPNSGAAQVGIQQNDILLMLGESPLGKPEDLYERLKQAGEKPVPLALLRSGGSVTLQVQPLIRVSLMPVAATAPSREYWIGISVTPLEPVLRAQLRLSPNHKVLVSEVYPGTPAAKAGIALHDIIVALDGNPVLDPNDVAKSVQAKGEKPLMLELIGKGGKSRTVAVTPERKKATETSQDALPLLNAALRNVVAYDIVGPGVLLDYTNDINLANQSAGAFLGQVPVILNSSSKSQDAGPALTQRLDALDSDLKELRKLVEALQKTANTIIEQKKRSPE